MKYRVLVLLSMAVSSQGFAASDAQLQAQIRQLQKQTAMLQKQLTSLQTQLQSHHVVGHEEHPVHSAHSHSTAKPAPATRPRKPHFHSTALFVHTPDKHPEAAGFYPTALLAGDQVITYIAGTPVVSSPFLGSRPAFDGSDYIVNISSINRDVRLMQQRRRLYHAYDKIGYPRPDMPIISLSGAVQPAMSLGRSYAGRTRSDFTLGTGELDVAAAVNQSVEAYMAIAYDESPPAIGGPRVSNSAFDLSMGFVNIGNLDKSPFYFTGGQLYAPFGRYSTAMISAPLTLRMARTLTRPFIFGYKSQHDGGPYAAVYGFKSDTILGNTGVGGVNAGYIFAQGDMVGDLGGGYISNIANAAGMQDTGVPPGTVFGGFGSVTNGSEFVRRVPAANIHANVSIDRYNFAAEWVGATESFRTQDLSFNGLPAKPQAIQLEAGATFVAFDRPASVGLGYQWSSEALALQLPKQRIAGVFNISIWKDTIESLEFRHDIDYKASQFANGIAPVGVINAPVIGSGSSADTLLAQIGVFF